MKIVKIAENLHLKTHKIFQGLLSKIPSKISIINENVLRTAKQICAQIWCISNISMEMYVNRTQSQQFSIYFFSRLCRLLSFNKFSSVLYRLAIPAAT